MTSGRHLRKRSNCLSRTPRRISMNGVRCLFSIARIKFSTPLKSGFGLASLGLAGAVGAGIGTIPLRMIDQERGELPDVFLGGARDIEPGELGIQVFEGRPVDRVRYERADIRHADL